MARPYGVEVPGVTEEYAAKLEHGTPMLLDGRLQADWRDASFLNYPDTHSIKARHICVASHRYAVGSGMVAVGAACDPTRIMLLESPSDATDVHANGRCSRPGCRQLFALAEREASALEHFDSYYGLRLHGGMRATFEGRPCTLIGYDSPYVRLLLDPEREGGKPVEVTTHPVSEMVWPEEAYTGRHGRGTREIARPWPEMVAG